MEICEDAELPLWLHQKCHIALDLDETIAYGDEDENNLTEQDIAKVEQDMAEIEQDTTKTDIQNLDAENIDQDSDEDLEEPEKDNNPSEDEQNEDNNIPDLKSSLMNG